MPTARLLWPFFTENDRIRYVFSGSPPCPGEPYAELLLFKKEKQIAALERTDAEKASLLTSQGWEKQFEEIDAPSAKKALVRFADLRKEEIETENAFVAGSVFSSIVTAFFR
jgi:hypothetical protein